MGRGRSATIADERGSKVLSHESRPAIGFRQICMTIHIIWISILPENVVQFFHGYAGLYAGTKCYRLSR